MKQSLSSDQRVLLFHSICQFFELNGFSKSLNKFLKEAKLEKESWKSCSLNMEEMCYEYLKICDGVKGIDKVVMQNGGKETKSEEVVGHKSTDVCNGKSKKKYKCKSANDSSEQVVGETHSKPSDNNGEATVSLPSEPAKKSTDKKKKHKDDSDFLNEGAQEKQVASNDVEKKDKKEKKEKSKIKRVQEETMIPNDSSADTKAADKENKSSKKRKKLSSEENVTSHVEGSTVGDNKRRKTDNADLPNGDAQPPKTPNVSDNGVLEIDGAEKSQKRNKSKQCNGSAEPTSANAFRRVKPEEVEFVDDRLQDNSYWAKSGADSGYGAKAQEVLGQVRGKDFRHEKTKKKRGSYRGGQIDLQTHSVKFHYDDDDE